MGDRSVLGIRQGEHETLYLYCHWDGSDQENILAQGLQVTRGRWRDFEYASRILVSHFVGSQWDNELGYGLSVGTYPQPDYDYIYEVDWEEGKVYKVTTHGAMTSSWTFDEFIWKQSRARMVPA
jgi:hypothetical protein